MRWRGPRHAARHVEQRTMTLRALAFGPRVTHLTALVIPVIGLTGRAPLGAQFVEDDPTPPSAASAGHRGYVEPSNESVPRGIL
jgi:hypothetical protein